MEEEIIVHLTEAELARVDALISRISTPERRMTRAEALRALARRGLDELEREDAARRKVGLA